MQTKPSARAVGRLTLAILLALCAYAQANNMIGMTMNDIIDEFSLSGAAQGLMASMMGFGSIAALLSAPLLQGRAPKFHIILLSGALILVTLIMTGAAPNMAVMLLACALFGVGGSMFDNFTNAYMVDLHREESTRYLGYLHGFYGMGGLVAPLLISQLMALGNWRTAYYGVGGVFAVLMACYALGGFKNYRRASVNERAQEYRLSLPMLKEYLLNPRNLLLIAAGGLYAASQMGIVGWVVRYMKLRFDAEGLGSIGISTFWVCATLSRFAAPHIPAKPMKIFVIGALSSACAHALGVLAGTPLAMLVACALIGLTSGHSMSMLVAIATRGNEDRTTLVTSAMLFSMAVLRILMPLLMGEVTTGMSITAAMYLPALAAALSGTFGYLSERARA